MVVYVDEGEEYPDPMQPPGLYVQMAVDELPPDAEVPWPTIHARAWELFAAEEGGEGGEDVAT